MAGDWISGNFVDATRNATDVYRPSFTFGMAVINPLLHIYICKYTLSIYICVCVCMYAMQCNAMECNAMEWNGMVCTYVRTYVRMYISLKFLGGWWPPMCPT